MRSEQLYLNDKLIQLWDDSPIALTFQINNIAEIRDQQGNTSKQFKIPMSTPNRKALGFPNDMSITTELPYRKYTAKYIVDGIEIIPFGLGELERCDNDYAYVTIISGNADFFDLLIIKMTEMSDQFAPYEHEWNLANVINSQTKTDGWKYPVIDYGNMGKAVDSTVDVRYLRPAFFLHTAVSLFADYTGYTIEGELLTNDFYKKILIPFASDKFTHGQDFQTQLGLKFVNGSNYGQTFETDVSANFLIPFGVQVNDPSGSWNGSKYTAQETMKVKVSLLYDLLMSDFYGGGSTPSITIELRINGVGGVYYNYHVCTPEFTQITLLDQTLQAEFNIEQGDTIEVYAVAQPAPNSPKRIVAGLIFGHQNTITIDPIEQDVIFGQDVQCEKIMPDVGQKEFLKDMFQKFGIFVSTDNYRKVVTFTQFKEIVAKIPIADDWSRKVVDQGKQTEFSLGNYGQVNKMLYLRDENVTQYYGDSQILIDDTTLPPDNTLFTSIYSACLDTDFHKTIRIPIIKKIEDNAEVNPDTGLYEFTVSTQPRILIDKIITPDVAVNFTDGDTTVSIAQISTPYFDSTLDSLKYDYLKTLNYSELEHVLFRCKKIVRYANLKPLDIQNLDITKPVFIKEDGQYFYKNRIDSWMNGVVTKVELVKL